MPIRSSNLRDVVRALDQVASRKEEKWRGSRLVLLAQPEMK
jgi:hypothetical protein